jgi:hypothetical protein
MIKVKLFAFLFLYVCLLIPDEIKGQSFIAIDKPEKVKRIKFYKGDFIEFFDTNKVFRSGKVQFILDSSFVIQNEEVFINSILKVKSTKSNFGFKLLSKVSFIAGSGYLILDSGNQLINSEKPFFHKRTLKSSSVMLGISLVCHIFSTRYYRINKRHPIKIINITI